MLANLVLNAPVVGLPMMAKAKLYNLTPLGYRTSETCRALKASLGTLAVNGA